MSDSKSTSQSTSTFVRANKHGLKINYLSISHISDINEYGHVEKFHSYLNYNPNGESMMFFIIENEKSCLIILDIFKFKVSTYTELKKKIEEYMRASGWNASEQIIYIETEDLKKLDHQFLRDIHVDFQNNTSNKIILKLIHTTDETAELGWNEFFKRYVHGSNIKVLPDYKNAKASRELSSEINTQILKTNPSYFLSFLHHLFKK
jgi:hypothetical protein